MLLCNLVSLCLLHFIFLGGKGKRSKDGELGESKREERTYGEFKIFIQ